MTPRRSAVCATVAAVLTVLTVPVLDAPTAGAWTDGACPTSAGVTVVVDFQQLGGGVVVRCATGAPDTGFQALDQAGFRWTPTARFPGFLCRIEDRPGNDPCQTTPPTTAYWSYWNAVRGGGWCYGNFGAGNRRPPEGTVEGWSFSLDRASSSAPTPRTQPPPHVPGAPTSMPDGGCAGSGAVTAPPTTATPGRPPTGAATAPAATASVPGAPAASPGRPLASAGSTGPALPTGDAVNGAPPVTVTGAGTDPSAATTPAEASSTEATAEPAGPTDGVETTTTALTRTEVAAGRKGGASSPSREGAGSPVSLIVALAVVAALTATSAIVRRRATADK